MSTYSMKIDMDKTNDDNIDDSALYNYENNHYKEDICYRRPIIDNDRVSTESDDYRTDDSDESDVNDENFPCCSSVAGVYCNCVPRQDQSVWTGDKRHVDFVPRSDRTTKLLGMSSETNCNIHLVANNTPANLPLEGLLVYPRATVQDVQTSETVNKPEKSHAQHDNDYPSNTNDTVTTVASLATLECVLPLLSVSENSISQNRDILKFCDDELLPLTTQQEDERVTQDCKSLIVTDLIQENDVSKNRKFRLSPVDTEQDSDPDTNRKWHLLQSSCVDSNSDSVTKVTETCQCCVNLPVTRDWLEGDIKPPSRHFLEYMLYMNYPCHFTGDHSDGHQCQNHVPNWPIPTKIDQLPYRDENEKSPQKANYYDREELGESVVTGSRHAVLHQTMSRALTDDEDGRSDRQSRSDNGTMRLKNNSVFVVTGTPQNNPNVKTSSVDTVIATGSATGEQSERRKSYLSTILETGSSDVDDNRTVVEETIKIDWGSRTPFVFTEERTVVTQSHPLVDLADLSQEGDHCHGNTASLAFANHVPPPSTRRRKTPGLDISLIRGTTVDKERPHRTSLPAHFSEYTIQNGRSPAKRKRDSVLKRRHNSASAIQISSVCSSVPSSLSSMSECNEEGIGHTDDTNISNTNDPQSLGFIRLHSGTTDDKEPIDSSSKPELKIRPVHSNSCPQIETSYQVFDIVGDESGVRFPWQRDVAIQCNIQVERGKYVKSKSIDTSSSSSSLTPPNTLCTSYLDCNVVYGKYNVRPHSIGCLEGTVHEDEIERLRQEQARKSRKSDSFLQVSPRALRKRASFAISDEHGSVSDLGSISENPDIESRDLSLEDSHMSDLSSDLRRIALKSAEEYRDTTILPSPRVSPTIFNGSHSRNSGSDSDDCSGPDSHSRRYLKIPRKHSRRRSSLSLTSVSDDSDVEPSPPVARRGRRSAIVDTKNFGDVSPTTLSPEVSPSNSCDEGENASNIAERLRRRRSSVDLTMNVYPGDLLVHDQHRKLKKRNTIADLYSQKNGSSSSIADEQKKGKQYFSLRKLMKARSKESIPRLEDVLSQMKPSEFRDNHLSAYKNLHWSDLIASSDKQTEAVKLPEVERKRREAVWELFKSECVFLIDHLMVLKHCFMEPLKKVQVEGHVMFAEPQDIFGNLDELCYVSYTFCKDFISALLKDMSSTAFGSTTVLIQAFERFTTHSRDGGVYHIYCLNYVNALTYLEQLRRHEDFTEFEKWCAQDHRCNRLQLTDLLVAPMQHCTKFPLLLSNIKKYTDNSTERQLLTDLTDKVDVSLQKMEDKMKWAKNYERLQEIQGQLVWPSVADIDPRAFVPDFLKSSLTKQPCERMICSPKRQLLHEGYLTLVESAKTSDIYVFLFDDILLITRTKKPQRKKHSIDSAHIRLQQQGQTEKTAHTVYRQPVALDRLSVHDINQTDATANGLKHAFVLVQISRYQQIIGVFTLQAVTDAHKAIWMDKLSQARDKFSSVPDVLTNQTSPGEEAQARESLISSDIVRATKQNRRTPSLRNPHGKSLSMDAVYL